MIDSTVLSKHWKVLRNTRFEQLGRDGQWFSAQREVYELGDGAAVLLFNPERGTVLLTRQFRLPPYLNRSPADGLLIEVCAGLLDGDSPEDCVRQEAAQETGVQVGPAKRLFAAHASPGAVSQKVHCFCAPYHGQPPLQSAGLREEGEDIEVLEMTLQDAVAGVYDGRIEDAKTIMLLLHAACVGMAGLDAGWHAVAANG
jgi:nudix-type nucleoside diphosphatase (YffH/AdpP family)